MAHQVVWAIVTGEWPGREIDHKNTIRSDNRFDNLRQATATENQRNKRFYGNTAGFKGVYKNNPAYPNSTYRATIMVDGKYQYLGTFKTAEDAHAAYCAATERLFGEFARVA